MSKEGLQLNPYHQAEALQLLAGAMLKGDDITLVVQKSSGYKWGSAILNVLHNLARCAENEDAYLKKFQREAVAMWYESQRGLLSKLQNACLQTAGDARNRTIAADRARNERLSLIQPSCAT